MKQTMVAVLMGFMITGCATHKDPSNGVGSGTIIDGASIDGSLIGDNGSYQQEGDRSLFDPVFFAFDSSQVNPNESGKIEAVANYLNKRKAKGVIVEGHADERGSREYNLALGEERALAVRDYLIALGIDSAMIQTKSYGEENPGDEGHDEQAWNRNRRAVFAIWN